MDRDQAIKLMQELLKRVVEKVASDTYHHRQFPTGDQDRRRDPAAIGARPERRAVGHAGAGDHERPPDQGIRRHQGMQFRDRAARHRPLSRQCVRPAGPRRCVLQVTINAKIPSFEELDLPSILKEVVLSKRGLVIVVGGTGSGKSTTLASMLGYRNDKTRGHIVTIEDPVEYVHQHKGCVITHREVGVDTDPRHAALHGTPSANCPGRHPGGSMARSGRSGDHGVRHSVRRDRSTAVLATLHANNSNQALDRIINFFPEERREQLLMDMSLNIRALISQRLIPREAGTGRHRRDGNRAELTADPGPDLPRRSRQDQKAGSQSTVALESHRHEDLRPGAVRAVRNRGTFPTRMRCAIRI